MWCYVQHIEAEKMVSILQTTCSDVFFFNDDVWISLTISLKFVPKFQINNIPVLIQIMVWRRSDAYMS